MESTLTITLHGVTLASTLTIIGILLKEHKVWIRMKDRLNQLWMDRCKAKGDDYVALGNGDH